MTKPRNDLGGELVEVLDDSLNVIGCLPRCEAHRLGLWHRTFNCWVLLSEDEDDVPTAIVQRRAPNVSVYAGMLDVSAAGHIRHDETVIAGGVRELQEELGLLLTAQRLNYLGEHLDFWQAHPGVIGREVCSVFSASVILNEFRLDLVDPQEVSSIFSCEISSLVALFSAKCTQVLMRRLWPPGQQQTQLVMESDFAPRSASHYLSSLLAARDHHSGIGSAGV